MNITHTVSSLGQCRVKQCLVGMVGCAGDCIIAMAGVCLAGEDAGLKGEAARLCASIAAMPRR